MSKTREFYSFCISITISLFVSIRLGLYYYTDDIGYLSYLSKAIMAHCASDLLITRKLDAQIHHIITLGILSAVSYVQMDNVAIYPTMLPSVLTFYSVELSTVFLNINYVLENLVNVPKTYAIVAHFNRFVFIALFFKTRIYGFYPLLSNNHTYVIWNQFVGHSSYWTMHLYGFVYAFWFLNLYWYTVLCKMLYKQLVIGLFPQWNTDQMCSSIVAYSGLSWIAYALYNYYWNPHWLYLVDIFGITMLSVSSYFFHSSCVASCNIKKHINYISDSIFVPFLSDIYCIRIRSFLIIVVAVYNSVYAKQYILLSILLNIVSFTYFMAKMLEMRSQGVPVYSVSDPKLSQLMNIHYLTVILDILIGCISTNERICWFRISTIIFMLCAIGIIRPLYNLNHVAIHAMCYLLTVWSLACTNCVLMAHSYREIQ
jgi:hypothetical protein